MLTQLFVVFVSYQARKIIFITLGTFLKKSSYVNTKMLEPLTTLLLLIIIPADNLSFLYKVSPWTILHHIIYLFPL